MTAITLPTDREAWARAEVAAGRAESVEAAIAKGVRGYRLEMETFRKSLDPLIQLAHELIAGNSPVAIRLGLGVVDLTAEAEREEAAGKAAERSDGLRSRRRRGAGGKSAARRTSVHCANAIWPRYSKVRVLVLCAKAC